MKHHLTHSSDKKFHIWYSFFLLIPVFLLLILFLWSKSQTISSADLTGQIEADSAKPENTSVYTEKFLISVNNPNDDYCSFFMDDGEPYFLMHSAWQGYYLVHAKGGEENIRSRFHDSFSLWREETSQLAEEKSLTYSIVTTPDQLYLVGRGKNQMISRIYCIFPNKAYYEPFQIPVQFKKRSFRDWYAGTDLTLYASVSNDIYSYAPTNDRIRWECDVYRYENISHFLAGKNFYYYIAKGKIYQIDRQDQYSHMNFIPNERITDVESPACLDRTDRLYIADSCGIMSYAPGGCLWELLISSTDKEAFQGEDQKLMDLFRTEDGSFYLVVQDEKNRQVKLYAYTHDRR